MSETEPEEELPLEEPEESSTSVDEYEEEEEVPIPLEISMEKSKTPQKKLIRTKKEQEIVTETQFQIVRGRRKPWELEDYNKALAAIKPGASIKPPQSGSRIQKSKVTKPLSSKTKVGKKDLTASERGRRRSSTFSEEEEAGYQDSVPPSSHSVWTSSSEEEPLELEIKYSEQIYPNYADRHHWTPSEYMLCSIVVVLDLSNWLKFPALYMKHGGLVFLVPYLGSTLLCSLPFLLFETIVGQFTREGMINSWKICPLFKGLGWFILVQNLMNIIYIQQVVSWACQYVVEGGKSITGTPELASCNDYWNPGTLSCEEVQDKFLTPHTGSQYFRGVVLTTISTVMKDRGLPTETRTTNEYNMMNYGSPVGHLIIGVGFGYFATFIGLFYKQKLTVKLGIIALAFSLLSIGLLTVRGMASPGARHGLGYTMIVTDFKHLTWIATWREGFSYSLYSPSIGFGLHLTMGSFKHFKSPLKRHCIHIIAIDIFGSIVMGLIISMFAGVHAFNTGRTEIDEIERVPEMIFEIVPQNLVHSKYVWIYLFFVYLGLGLIGIYYTMINVLTVSASILDVLRQSFQKRKYKRAKRLSLFRIGVGILLLILFCLTIPVGTFNGSIYINRIIDDNRLCAPILSGLFLFSLIGGYITGPQYLSDCHHAMTGTGCGKYWRFCWKITMPAIILITLLSTLSFPNFFQESEYRGRKIHIAVTICFIIIRAFPLLSIPIFMCQALGSINSKHKKMRWALVLSPKQEHQRIISSGQAKRLTLAHYFSFGGEPYEPMGKIEEDIKVDQEEIPIEQIPAGYVIKTTTITPKPKIQ